MTTASPLQIAITRAIDGRPLGPKLWAREEVKRAFGGALPPTTNPPVSPRMIAILAAIRCGKSMMSAAKALAASQTVDVRGLKPGDEIRIPILAPVKEAARQTYMHLVASVQSSPHLRGLLASPPTGESIWIRHPSGRVVEIIVTALAKYGVTLTSRWIAACILDEAPRMAGMREARKNLDEALRAVSLRILPGGQIMLIGSPYAAYGPIYDLVQERFGKPGTDCVVVRAPGYDLNPHIWTPEACEVARYNNPHEYRTDVLAEFDDPDDALIAANKVDKAVRKAPLERPVEDGIFYVAAMDPASTASAWTFVILGRVRAPDGASARPHFSVVVARQWRNQRKSDKDRDHYGIDVRTVLLEIKELCDRYRCTEVHTDQYAAEANEALAREYGLDLLIHNIDTDLKWAMAMAIRTSLDEGTLELPPVKELREDIVRVKRRLINNSVKPQIQLPVSGDGRHCDFFTSLGFVLLNPPDAPLAEGAKATTSDDEDFQTPNDNPWEQAARAASWL